MSPIEAEAPALPLESGLIAAVILTAVSDRLAAQQCVSYLASLRGGVTKNPSARMASPVM
jgi:hypothetical protein